MVDHSAMKLGKREVKIDARTLKMAGYVDPAFFATVPDAFDWTTKVLSWPMFMNNEVGDCAEAAAGHLIEAWTSNVGAEAVLNDGQIIGEYEKFGYQPGVQSSDRGTFLLDLLNSWRKTTFAGHALETYASVEPIHHLHVHAGIYVFGGMYIGLQLPITAQTQEVWDVVGGSREAIPGSWGGHCVPVLRYDADQSLWCVTWGGLKKMTRDFFETYCDESYVLISPDFIDASGVNPAMINLAQMDIDANELAA